MVPAVGRVLLLAWCYQRSLTEAANATIGQQVTALMHKGEDCYFSCWKEAGYCEWCGQGNACCRQGDDDDDPIECKGPLTYLASGKFHECVVPSFSPGQQPPPQLETTGTIADMAKAQCITYMAEKGCGWTNKNSCPSQQLGWDAPAENDGSIDYKCCCVNGLWKESATLSDTDANNAKLLTKEQCKPFMEETGCAWTADWGCPSQPAPAGRKGLATDDGSTGYKCCCLNAMWQMAPVSTNGTLLPPTGTDANAFNVDHPMEPGALTPTLLPAGQDSGYGMQVTTGDEANKDEHFLDGHNGANVHVETVHIVDPHYEHTEHHGPIHNAFSINNAEAKKEGCTFGICADMDANDPDNMLPATAHGVPVAGQQVTGGKELPSYEISVKDSRRRKAPKVEIDAVTGGVATEIGSGVGQATGATAAPVLASPPAIAARVATGPTASATGPIAAAAAPPALSAKVAAAPAAPTLSAKALAGQTNATATDDTSSGSGSSGDGSSGSGRIGTIAVVVALLCCFCIATGGAGFMLYNRKAKPPRKKGTDREAYLKNDLINDVERQPMYHDVPGPQEEMEPMIKPQEPTASVIVEDGASQYMVTGVDRNRDGIPDAMEAPAPLVQMQPTPSFPMVAAGIPPVVTAPSGVSFPGMPTLGGSTYMQNTSMVVPQAQAYTQSYTMAPQTASMTIGSYANTAQTASYTLAAPSYGTPSTYVSAPYTQQLGMTTSLQPIQETGIRYG